MNWTKIIGKYQFNKFADSYKELNPNNMVEMDVKTGEIWGYRKGNEEGHWRYDPDSFKLYSDLPDKQVLSLINFKDMVAKGHPWA